jgi:integrase
MAARRRISKRKNWPDNLYQKPDGYFWYRNPDNGKTKGLGRDRVKAFDEAITANLCLSSKKATTLADWVQGGGTKTLAECAKAYELAYALEHPNPNTVKQMKSSIRFILAAPFASKPVNTVTTREIHVFLAETEASRGTSAARQRRTALFDIFFDAESQGLINRGHNPVEVTKTAKVTIKRDRLSLDQFMQILPHADPWLTNAMWLALLSGQARAEISNAMFSDFKDGYWYCQRGKTGAKIRIAVTLRLNAVGMSLDDVVKQCRNSGVVSKYLIHHRRSIGVVKAGAKVKMDTISNAFAAARDAAGVMPNTDKTPQSFHEIRSLSGRLYEREYQKEFTQKLFGHASLEMTEKYIDPRGSDWIDVANG